MATKYLFWVVRSSENDGVTFSRLDTAKSEDALRSIGMMATAVSWVKRYGNVFWDSDGKGFITSHPDEPYRYQYRIGTEQEYNQMKEDYGCDQ